MRRQQVGKSNAGATTMVLRMLPDTNERLVRDSNGTLMFNVAAFRGLSLQELHKAVRECFINARDVTSGCGKVLAPNTDFRPFTSDMIGLLPRPEFGDREIAQLVFVIDEYRSRARKPNGRIFWPEATPFGEYSIAAHGALVRYGNVELRVVENYLLEPDLLRNAFDRVVANYAEESEMYREPTKSARLTHDDFEFNIRRLMTNAGFYIGGTADSAWQQFTQWVDRYIAALSNCNLAWQRNHAFHYLRIQKALYEKTGTVPKYVATPTRGRIYENIAGKDVLFVSPLAHIVNEQVRAGRLGQLYKDFEVPTFSLRAVPAWISTWPNRPHGDWCETFGRMCEAIEDAWRKRPFEVFISSCGCYGLPVSEFVRSRFGCAVLYIGHAAHMLFGLFPNESSQSINREMWAKGDLGSYANLDRIDGGRYL